MLEIATLDDAFCMLTGTLWVALAFLTAVRAVRGPVERLEDPPNFC